MHPARDFGFNEFSPDGTLQQVNYATKAAEANNTAIGIIGKDCVVLITKDSTSNPLAVSSSKSIYPIDETIAAAFVGVSGDARPLVMGAQQKVAQKRFEFGEAPSVHVVADTLVRKMQEATMLCGSRPFGVSILLGGTSDGPKLVQILTNGEMNNYKAAVIGKGAAEIEAYLTENFGDEPLECEDAVTFALKTLLQRGPFTAKEIEITVLKEKQHQYSQAEKQSAIENAI